MPLRDLPKDHKFLVAFSFAGEQRELVRSIAIAVENRLGRSKVFLDEWYDHYLAGNDADLKLQDIYADGCVLAVVCVSESYGMKPWAQTEYAAIRARLMKSRTPANEGERLGILPVRVGNGEIKGILFNTIVPDARVKPLEETVELIVARLHLIGFECEKAGNSPTRPPWPIEPIYYEPDLADRTGQWPAIQKLMTADSAKRILIFKGPSGYSKTALINAAWRYAKILGVQTAIVDFKDSQLLSHVNVLRKLKLELGGVLPGFAATRELDQWTFIEDLRRLTNPALILLDTYEKLVDVNKELAEWIEHQLLAEVEQCAKLRVLIGGQKVPDPIQALWRECADTMTLDRIDDKETWKEWIQQKNPDVDEKHVEGIVLGLEGVPGNISTALSACAKKLSRIT